MVPKTLLIVLKADFICLTNTLKIHIYVHACLISDTLLLPLLK